LGELILTFTGRDAPGILLMLQKTGRDVASLERE